MKITHINLAAIFGTVLAPWFYYQGQPMEATILLAALIIASSK